MRSFTLEKGALVLIYFFFAILLNSTGATILLVQETFGVGETAASVLDPFKDLSIVVTSFIAGAFLARIGYRKSLLFTLMLVAAACFVVPLVNTFWSIKLIAAVTGLCFGVTKVAVFSAIGLITDGQKQHLSFMNFIEGVFMLGILTGYVLFSLAADGELIGNWVNTYVLIGVIAFIALLVLRKADFKEEALKSEETDTRNDLLLMVKLVVAPTVAAFLVCAFLNVLLEQSTMNWLPTFNNQAFHLSETLAIIMASLLAGSMAVGRFVASFFLRRIAWQKFLVIMLVAAAVFLVICLQVTSQLEIEQTIEHIADVPLVAFVLPFIGVFLAPIYPAINSVVLESLPQSKHAAMASLIVLFSAVGGSIGSVVTGALFEDFGAIEAFYISLVPIGMMAGGILIFNRLIKKDRKDA